MKKQIIPKAEDNHSQTSQSGSKTLDKNNSEKKCYFPSSGSGTSSNQITEKIEELKKEIEELKIEDRNRRDKNTGARRPKNHSKIKYFQGKLQAYQDCLEMLKPGFEPGSQELSDEEIIEKVLTGKALLPSYPQYEQCIKEAIQMARGRK